MPSQFSFHIIFCGHRLRRHSFHIIRVTDASVAATARPGRSSYRRLTPPLHRFHALSASTCAVGGISPLGPMLLFFDAIDIFGRRLERAARCWRIVDARRARDVAAGRLLLPRIVAPSPVVE